MITEIVFRWVERSTRGVSTCLMVPRWSPVNPTKKFCAATWVRLKLILWVWWVTYVTGFLDIGGDAGALNEINITTMCPIMHFKWLLLLVEQFFENYGPW